MLSKKLFRYRYKKSEKFKAVCPIEYGPINMIHGTFDLLRVCKLGLTASHLMIFFIRAYRWANATAIFH